jgi:hypothetical protein
VKRFKEWTLAALRINVRRQTQVPGLEASARSDATLMIYRWRCVTGAAFMAFIEAARYGN